MSQVDKLIYIPLLLWFLVFFIYLYITMFILIIPAIFKILSIRRKYFDKCINRTMQIFILINKLCFYLLTTQTNITVSHKSVTLSKLLTVINLKTRYYR